MSTKKKEIEDKKLKYEIGNDGNATNLLIHIEDKKEDPSLMDPAFRKKVLDVLKEEFAVDSLIISHLRETQHFEASMQVLNSLRTQKELLDNMRHRNPAEYPGKLDQKMSGICGKCPLNPITNFNRYYDEIELDVEKYYRDVKALAQNLKDPGRTNYCSRCITDTSHELNTLFDSFAEFTETILWNGFQIHKKFV